MMDPRTRNPYDIQLTHDQSGSSVTRGFIVAEQEGQLLYSQALLPEFSDTVRNDTFSGEHRNPQVDLPATFDRWHLGAGFEDAIDVGTLGFPGYHYTQGVDLSFGVRGYLGPEKQTGGSTTQAPIKFVDSELGLFAMTSRYVYENVAGTWTQRLDTGGTITNNDLYQFKTKTATFLVLGVSDQGYYLTTNGTSWRQVSTTDTAPSNRDGASTTSAGATSLTPVEPGGVAEDDIIVAAVVINADEAITPPAGWSEITQQTLTGVTARAALFWIRRGASAPSYAFTWTSSVRCAVRIQYIQNVYNSGSPFLPFTSANFNINASGTSHSTGTATVTWTKQYALAVFIGSDGASTGPGAWTAPSGYTETGDTSSAPGIEFADDATTSEGALSAATATSANACVSLGALLVLKPEMTGAIDVKRFVSRGSSAGEPLLWAIDRTGDLRQCTDPTNRSSWSAADATQMGQGDNNIMGLEVIDNDLFIVSNDGITAYDGTTVTTVWPASGEITSAAARPVVGPDKKLYYVCHNSIRRYDPIEGTIERAWPNGHQIGSSEINGTVTAIAFDDEGAGYFALANAASNYYVMEFDPFRQFEIDGEKITPVHTYYYNSSAAVNALLVAEPSSDSFSTTNHQLIMGDGTTADYLILPRPNLRPEDDSNVRFEPAADRLVYGSFINYRSQAFPKWVTRGDLEVDDADADDTIALQYQTVGGTATTITTANSDGRTTATLSSEVSATKVRPVFLFNNGANTTSPILLGAVLHAAPNAPRDRGWVFTVRIAEGQPLRNGLTTTRQDAQNQSDFLMNARNEYVTFIDMRGGSHNVKVLDIQPVATKFSIDRNLEEFYEVTLAELVS